MLIRVNDFSSSDTVRDVPAHITRGNIVTDGQNYQIVDGKLGARKGSTQPYGSPLVAPYYITSGIYGTTPYWLYLGLVKASLITSGTSLNVTRQTLGVDVDYTATELTPWTGGGFNGISILNNPNDVPQMLLSISGKLADMTYWPSDLRCVSLRPFKNYLIAANVIEAGNEYPQVLRWSHPADPGGVPATWDYTDTTKDAGRRAFAETKGILVDSLASQDVHIVYKNDSTFYMQAIGAPYIFDFQPISLTSGLLSQNCAANFPGGQVALTYDDVVLVTPRGITSIADKRIRKHLFSSLNFAKLHSAFVACHTPASEIWVCIPAGSTYCNRAYIWNWNDNKWSIRDLPNLTSMAQGYDVSATDTWDTWGDAPPTGTWDNIEGIWGGYDLSGGQLLATSLVGSGKLVAFEVGNTEDGTNLEVSITHDSTDMLAQDLPPERMKFVSRIRPHFTPESVGAVVTFEIGMRNGLQETINWSPVRTFTVGSSRDLFVRKQGRYLSMRIKSSCPASWGLDGLDVDLEMGGVY